MEQLSVGKTYTLESGNTFLAGVILMVLSIGLYGTMTNIIFISPFPSLVALLILVPVLILKKEQAVPKFVLWLYLFFFICVLSTLFYYAPSFASYEFYRYDGNFIISYLPLLVFPFLSFKIEVEKVLKRFVYFSIAVNLAFYLVYFIKSGGGVLIRPTEEGNVFNPFFKATNASGGFYSILASLVLTFYLESKKKVYLLLLFFVLLFLWGSTSRGSVLGLVLGISFYYLYKKGKKWLIVSGILLIIAVQAIIVYNTYPYYEAYLLDSADIGEDTGAFLSNTYGGQDTKEANVYIRAFDTWPRGTALFLNSPLIGSGFGSVNDLPIKLNSGLPSLLSFNGSKNHLYNDSHAHHSFLHFLAEVGIIGLIVFLTFWNKLFSFIKSNSTRIPSSVKSFLMIAMFNLVIMSFTEHRITTPSNVLPFVIILCIAVINHNYETAQSRKSVVS
jgi:O-antigen ligase